jgi:hypothetical protein
MRTGSFRSLLCAGLVSAMSGVQATASDMPDGTFANWNGCSQLERTPLAKIEAPNFSVLTHSGLKGYQFTCDFVNVEGRKGHWVATAFCEGAEVTYPDLFAVRRLDEERLQVSALTEAAAAANAESGSSGKPDSQNGEEPSLSAPPPPLADSRVEEASEDIYRLCKRIAE